MDYVICIVDLNGEFVFEVEFYLRFDIKFFYFDIIFEMLGFGVDQFGYYELYFSCNVNINFIDVGELIIYII